MRTRLDALVAICFMLAAVVEAFVRFAATPGRLALDAGAAALLGGLAVRRDRPLVSLAAVTANGLVVSLVTDLLWPSANQTATVPILAIMLATYSLGAHAGEEWLFLAVAAPAAVVLAADATMTSRELTSGAVFITVFTGVLPAAVGRVVRVRHDALERLREQHARIVVGSEAQRMSAVMTERLRHAERLQPSLLAGMRRLAEQAESAADPATIESYARELLRRTRDEVIALTAPVDPPGAVVAAPGRRAPRAVIVSVLGACWLAAIGWSGLFDSLEGTFAAAVVATGTAFILSVALPRRWAVVGLAGCLFGLLFAIGSNDPLGDTAAVVAFWCGGLAVGEVGTLVEQARTNNRVLAEHTAAATRRAVVEERLRVARDVHDTIGHSLTVVALQAGAARRLAADDPDKSAEAMHTIAQVTRDGLDALRQDETEIDSILERIRGAGLVVSASMSGTLPDGCLLVAVHRLVQEALTNVLRHAPGARAHLDIHRDHEAIRVRVTNTAPRREPELAGSGQGLKGVRERFVNLGGEVEWGTDHTGGFVVQASVPIRIEARA